MKQDISNSIIHLDKNYPKKMDWENFITCSFLNADIKIEILELALKKLNDLEVQKNVLKEWLDVLKENMQNTKKRQGFLSSSRLSSELLKVLRQTGVDTENYTLSLKDLKLDIQDSRWKSEVYEKLKIIFKYVDRPFDVSMKMARKVELENYLNFNVIKYTEYLQKPFEWIKKKIPSLEQMEVFENRIKVNLNSSEFLYLIQTLHENQIIKLPKYGSPDNFNATLSSEVLLRCFEIKNHLQEPVENPTILGKKFKLNESNVKYKNYVKENSINLDEVRQFRKHNKNKSSE